MPTQKFGKYRVLEGLGRGFFGPVYRAQDERLGRTACIQTIGQGIRWGPEDRSRFLDGYREIAALRHSNIAAVYDFGEEENTAYVAMEFLEGENLQNLLAAKTSFILEDKLSLIVQAAEGLKHAHGRGVLHRDIRPEKIFVESAGTVKILDFGLTHLLHPYLTHPHVRYGAPLYLSPEQIQGKECEKSSDIFSLGVVFHELIAGVHPFHDKDGNKALDNILYGIRLPLPDPDLPSGIQTILATCLEKEPANRYRSAAELLDACRDVLQEVDEDREFMQAELLMAFPRLKRAATSGQESPPQLRELLCGIRNIIECEEEADHAALCRLMSILGAGYSEIKAASRTPRPVRLPSSPLPAAPETGGLAVPDLPRQADETAGQEQRPLSVTPAPNLEERETPVSAAGQEPPGGGIRPSQTDSEEIVAGLAAEGSGTPASGPAELEIPASSPFPDDEEEQRISAAMKNPEPRAGFAGVFRRVALYAIGICGGILVLSLLTVMGYRIRDHFFNGVSSTRSEADSKGLQDNRHPVDQKSPASPAQGAPLQDNVLQDKGGSVSNPQPDALIKSDQAASAPDRPAGEIENLLALAAVMIQTGMLEEAKTMLDKADRIHPKLPETALLRKRLKARLAENAANAGQKGKEKKQAPAARLSTEEEARNRQVEGLFKKGRYPEAQSMLDRWQQENAESSQAREWKTATEEAQQILQKFVLAIGEKKYAEATDALNKLERINPTDPHIPELRQQVEGRNKAAKAHLTIYRLGEPASLRLDDLPFGKNGEAENEEVSTGRHTVSVLAENAPPLVWNQDLFDEQKVFLIYDAAKPVLRAMNEGDLERRRDRKAAEQVYSIPVNHEHGLFRGSCAGELRVNAFSVEFVPDSGAHGFRVAFRDLKLKVRGKSIELCSASDNKEFQSLKVDDSNTARKLKEHWEKLESFAR